MKKIFLVLSLVVLAETTFAQKNSDPAISNMTDQELGLHLLQKSKKQKTASYIFMGIATAAFAAATYVVVKDLNALDEETVADLTPVALGVVAVGSSTASLVLFTAAMRNSGKSEMLLRKKLPDEVPGYELDLGMKYGRKARQQKMIGMALLGSGVLLLTVADQSSATTTAGFIAVAASTPFIVNASKNKGRASVLLKKESIPFSYYSKPLGLNSVTLSVPFGYSR